MSEIIILNELEWTKPLTWDSSYEMSDSDIVYPTKNQNRLAECIDQRLRLLESAELQ